MKHKCPICGKEIKKQFYPVYGPGNNVVTCKNECFDQFAGKYPKCPICKEGKLSETCFHGYMYKKCDKCGFEISVDSLIGSMIQNKI